MNDMTAPALAVEAATAIEPQQKFNADDWDASRFDVQHWLGRAAWRTLKDTSYGISPGVGLTHRAVHETAWSTRSISSTSPPS